MNPSASSQISAKSKEPSPDTNFKSPGWSEFKLVSKMLSPVSKLEAGMLVNAGNPSTQEVKTG